MSRTSKPISIDQMSFLLNNGSSMTVIELSRATKLGITKIKAELKKANITPVMKVYERSSGYRSGGIRKHYPTGLMPK